MNERIPSPRYTAKDILDGTYRGGLAKYRKDEDAQEAYRRWHADRTRGKCSKCTTWLRNLWQH